MLRFVHRCKWRHRFRLHSDWNGEEAAPVRGSILRGGLILSTNQGPGTTGANSADPLRSAAHHPHYDGAPAHHPQHHVQASHPAYQKKLGSLRTHALGIQIELSAHRLKALVLFYILSQFHFVIVFFFWRRYGRRSCPHPSSTAASFNDCNTEARRDMDGSGRSGSWVLSSIPTHHCCFS